MAVSPWTAVDGWPLRSFCRAAEGPAKGSLLFLGGRGDFFEKYLEAFDAWAAGGWNLGGFDWRGQGGSGLMHPAGFCHVEDFSTFVGDLAAYCAHWRSATPGPHIAIGHSMGGHILLRAAAEGLVELDGVVLLSPMIGIRAGPLRGRAIGALAAIGRVPALRERPIWNGPASPAQGRITSCRERHADKLWWKSARPELARRGPTWGWLSAAARSIAELDRLLRQRPIALPGLILSTVTDPVIDSRAIRRIGPYLPGFEHRLIKGAGHELLRESDTPRGECMRQIGRFLAERLEVRPPASGDAPGLSRE